MTLALADTSVAPSASAPGWIDLKEAARRSGWDEGYVRRRCSDAARCPGGTWQSLGLARQERPAEGGKPRWLVHETADAKLAPVKTVERLSDDFDLRTLPAAAQAVVLERERKVLALQRACGEAVAAGRRKADALDELLARFAAEGSPVTRSTLLLWRQQYSTAGRRGLVDGRSQRSPRGDTPTVTDPGPFLNEVQRLYLDQRGRSARLCYDRARDVASAEDWPICSYATAWRFLRKLPRRTVAIHRGGEEAYKAAAACNTRDYTSIDSNDVWVGDHHRFDVICQLPDGTKVRPWLTAWLDMRSRMIVGWTIYAADPNADRVLSTFKAGIEQHGAPWNVYIDNGKDYDSFCLQGLTKQQRRQGGRDVAGRLKDGGVFGRLGVKVIHARPYCPQSKTIERFFGTVASRFSPLFETYCGRDTSSKPEDLPAQLKSGKAPTVEEVAAHFADWLEADYHHKPHEGDGMDGRAPAAAFADELKRKRVLPTTLLEELSLERTAPVKVGRNGVRWQRQWYGRNHPDLLKLETDGAQVQLGIDHANLNVVRVYALDGRWVCTVPANEKLPVLADKQTVREAVAQERRDRKTAKAYHQARPRLSMTLTDRLYEKAAGRRAAKAPPDDNPPPSLVPVRSDLEGQLPAMRKAVERFPMKQAAGAECDPMPARFMYGATGGADDEPAAGASFRELLAHQPTPPEEQTYE